MIFTAYIPRYYICQLLVTLDKRYLEGTFLKQIEQTGIMKHDDELCFWTDAYFSTAEEMEKEYQKRGVKVIDHFAQDGMTPLFYTQVDAWSEGEFAA